MGTKSSSELTTASLGRGATLLTIPEPAHTRQRFGFSRSKGGKRESTLISPLVATLATVPLTESPSLPDVVNSQSRDSFFQLYSTRTPLPQDMANLSSPGSRTSPMDRRLANPRMNSPSPNANTSGAKTRAGAVTPPKEDERPTGEMSRSYSPPTRLSAYMERAIRRPSVLDLANLTFEEPPATSSAAPTATKTPKEDIVKPSKSLDDLRSGGQPRDAASTKASRRSAIVRSRSASSAIEIAGALPHVTVREGPSKGPTPPTTPSRQRTPSTPDIIDTYQERIPPLPASSTNVKRRSQSVSSIVPPPPRMPMGLPSSPASSRRNSVSSSAFGPRSKSPWSQPGTPSHSRNGSAVSSAGLPAPPRIPVGLPPSPASSRRNSISSSHTRSASATSSAGLPPPPKLSNGLPAGPASGRSPAVSSLARSPSRLPTRQPSSSALNSTTTKKSSAPSNAVISTSRDDAPSVQPSLSMRSRTQRPVPINGAPSRAMIGLPASPASSVRNRDVTASPASSMDLRQEETVRSTAQTPPPRIAVESIAEPASRATLSEKRARRQSRIPRTQNDTSIARPRPSIDAINSDALAASLAMRRPNMISSAPQNNASQPIATREAPNLLAQRGVQQSSRAPVAPTYRQRPGAAPSATKTYGYI